MGISLLEAGRADEVDARQCPGNDLGLLGFVELFAGNMIITGRAKSGFGMYFDLGGRIYHDCMLTTCSLASRMYDNLKGGLHVGLGKLSGVIGAKAHPNERQRWGAARDLPNGRTDGPRWCPLVTRSVC